MISYNEDTVFLITFETKTTNYFKDHFEHEFHFNYLPRVGDVIEIDGYYNKVLNVQYNYKNQFSATVQIESLGDYDEYSRNYLRNLKS